MADLILYTLSLTTFKYSIENIKGIILFDNNSLFLASQNKGKKLN